MLYFAYGSNMPPARLISRILSARLVHTAALTGHDLRFHKISIDKSGKCDAFHTGKEADSIMGVIYKIDPNEKVVLDKFEPGYKTKEIEVVTASGENVKAFTYYAVRINEELRPYDWYRHHVIAGAKEHGFPDKYIEFLEAIEFVCDKNQERREKQFRIYQK